MLAYHAVSGWPAHRHFFFTSEVLSLIGIAGLARATGRWAQFYQIAVVPVQRLQDQSRPRTEAQDEILQSQSTADLVPCVDEPQQQTVASPSSSLVSCSSHSRDCSITFIREALERTWQSYGVLPPCQQHTIPQKWKIVTGATFYCQNIHKLRHCSNRLKNGTISLRRPPRVHLQTL